MDQSKKKPKMEGSSSLKTVQGVENKSKYTKNHRQNKVSENRLIYRSLREAKQPLTRRQLSERTGLEIATLCRALWNLIEYPRTIKVTHYAPCKKTGRNVMHFYFNKKRGGSNA